MIRENGEFTNPDLKPQITTTSRSCPQTQASVCQQDFTLKSFTPEKEGRGSPILEARGVVGEAGAGGVDGLQLREAWGYWGATREPATATPRGHRRGVEQATLLLHLQAQGHDATPCPQAAG